jgi:hypothetical protein
MTTKKICHSTMSLGAEHISLPPPVSRLLTPHPREVYQSVPHTHPAPIQVHTTPTPSASPGHRSLISHHDRPTSIPNPNNTPHQHSRPYHHPSNRDPPPTQHRPRQRLDALPPALRRRQNAENARVVDHPAQRRRLPLAPRLHRVGTAKRSRGRCAPDARRAWRGWGEW